MENTVLPRRARLADVLPSGPCGSHSTRPDSVGSHPGARGHGATTGLPHTRFPAAIRETRDRIPSGLLSPVAGQLVGGRARRLAPTPQPGGLGLLRHRPVVRRAVSRGGVRRLRASRTSGVTPGGTGGVGFDLAQVPGGSARGAGSAALTRRQIALFSLASGSVDGGRRCRPGRLRGRVSVRPLTHLLLRQQPFRVGWRFRRRTLRQLTRGGVDHRRRRVARYELPRLDRRAGATP